MLRLGDKLVEAIEESKKIAVRRQLEEDKDQKRKRAEKDRMFNEQLNLKVQSIISSLPRELIAKAKAGETEYVCEILPYNRVIGDHPAIIRLKRYCEQQKLKLKIDSYPGCGSSWKHSTIMRISW